MADFYCGQTGSVTLLFDAIFGGVIPYLINFHFLSSVIKSVVNEEGNIEVIFMLV